MPPEPPPPPDEPFSTEHLRRLLDRAREAVVMAQGETSESLRTKRLRGHWRSPSEAGLAGLAGGCEDSEHFADEVERVVRTRTPPRSLDKLDPDR